MKKIISYILTPLFHFAFGAFLGIFHIAQVLSLKLGGYSAHKKSVDFLNFFLLKSTYLMGSSITVRGLEKLPKGCPLIIISNHQSQYDIPPVVWWMRDHHPKFISKIELGKGIPSISYNLRHGGSALIDRKNGGQSIKEVMRVGKLIEKNNWSVCIYPEGTRSKTGELRTFQPGGVKTLLKVAPSALIIPFVIEGNNRFQKNGFPMGVGEKLTYEVLDPIDPKGANVEELVANVQTLIQNRLNAIREENNTK